MNRVFKALLFILLIHLEPLPAYSKAMEMTQAEMLGELSQLITEGSPKAADEFENFGERLGLAPERHVALGREAYFVTARFWLKSAEEKLAQRQPTAASTDLQLFERYKEMGDRLDPKRPILWSRFSFGGKKLSFLRSLKDVHARIAEASEVERLKLDVSQATLNTAVEDFEHHLANEDGSNALLLFHRIELIEKGLHLSSRNSLNELKHKAYMAAAQSWLRRAEVKFESGETQNAASELRAFQLLTEEGNLGLSNFKFQSHKLSKESLRGFMQTADIAEAASLLQELERAETEKRGGDALEYFIKFEAAKTNAGYPLNVYQFGGKNLTDQRFKEIRKNVYREAAQELLNTIPEKLLLTTSDAAYRDLGRVETLCKTGGIVWEELEWKDEKVNRTLLEELFTAAAKPAAQYWLNEGENALAKGVSTLAYFHFGAFQTFWKRSAVPIEEFTFRKKPFDLPTLQSISDEIRKDLGHSG